MMLTTKCIKPQMLLAAAAFAAVSLPASAATNLTIRMTDSFGTITVADNQTIPAAGDTDPTTGIIDFDSALGPALPGGTHFSAQAEICSSGCPNLAASIEWDNFGLPGDTLIFEVSAKDYTLLPIHWEGLHALGGTTPATVTAEAFWSDTNNLFDPKFSIGGPFSYTNPASSPFSGFSANLPQFPIAGANPFSMTTIITITHGASENFLTQVDTIANLTPVPVPAALPLLASAFGIMGFLRMRRRG